MLISISQRVNKVNVLVIKDDNDPTWPDWKGTTGSNVFVEVGNLLSPEQKGRFWEEPHVQTVKIHVFYFLVDIYPCRIENFLRPMSAVFFRVKNSF